MDVAECIIAVALTDGFWPANPQFLNGEQPLARLLEAISPF